MTTCNPCFTNLKMAVSSHTLCQNSAYCSAGRTNNNCHQTTGTVHDVFFDLGANFGSLDPVTFLGLDNIQTMLEQAEAPFTFEVLAGFSATPNVLIYSTTINYTYVNGWRRGTIYKSISPAAYRYWVFRITTPTAVTLTWGDIGFGVEHQLQRGLRRNILWRLRHEYLESIRRWWESEFRIDAMSVEEKNTLVNKIVKYGDILPIWFHDPTGESLLENSTMRILLKDYSAKRTNSNTFDVVLKFEELLP